MVVDINPGHLKSWPQIFMERENIHRVAISEWQLNNIAESNFPIPCYSQIENTAIFLEPREKDKAALTMVANTAHEIDSAQKHLISPRGLGSRMLHALFIVNSGAEKIDYFFKLRRANSVSAGRLCRTAVCGTNLSVFL